MAIISYTDKVELCPEGTYPAVCNYIKDELNVERKKFNSEELEIADVTQFSFIVYTNEKPYTVKTKKMKINGHSNSALCKFLSSWLGGIPMEEGWDYCVLKGNKAFISIKHTKGSGDIEFANISNIMPLPEGMEINDNIIDNTVKVDVDIVDNVVDDISDETPF